MTMDKIHWIREKCLKDPAGAVETLIRYKFIPSDLDVINHLGMLTKIKPRFIKKLKKDLSDALGK